MLTTGRICGYRNSHTELVGVETDASILILEGSPAEVSRHDSLPTV